MGTGKIDGEVGRWGDGEREMISNYDELRVFQNAMDACMTIFELTKKFPPEERYSLTDHVRRSSRSVCANLAEAWRRRRYKGAFEARLNDAESEAAETQVWLDLAARCGYLAKEQKAQLKAAYDQIGAQIVTMLQSSERWVLKNVPAPPRATPSPRPTPPSPHLPTSAKSANA
jgi:four helix bundle protein